MKVKALLFALCTTAIFIACDDTTTTLGSSLTSNTDNLVISKNEFEISTRSIAAGNIVSRSTTGYLGAVRDPETGDYITANYMTQFHTLEDYSLPEKEKITSLNDKGEVIADSCELRLFFETFYGDSVTAMKLTAHEMERPMTEAMEYETSFDPKEDGFIREGGLKVSKAYALTDMNVERSSRDDSDYAKNIRVMLNKEYTDKDGNTYNNFGTYIMRKYYEDPDYFKNSVKLTNNVVPGFYFETTGGLGCMAYIRLSQLNFYFKYHTTVNDVDTVVTGTTSFAGTEEVMQHTTIKSDDTILNNLIADKSCTYLKTPAGIFTEVTFPVDEICYEHDNDTINSAKFSLQRINDTTQSKYNFDVPSELLLLPKDSLNSFFKNNDVANYKTSYLASYSSSDNTYTFNNVGSLIKAMQQAKANGETSENWNKAVLVPVKTTYATVSSGTVLTKVIHDMGMTSTRLVGGEENPYDKIKLYVIYSKYK